MNSWRRELGERGPGLMYFTSIFLERLRRRQLRIRTRHLPDVRCFTDWDNAIGLSVYTCLFLHGVWFDPSCMGFVFIFLIRIVLESILHGFCCYSFYADFVAILLAWILLRSFLRGFFAILLTRILLRSLRGFCCDSPCV
jgi:hypothetical protein